MLNSHVNDGWRSSTGEHLRHLRNLDGDLRATRDSTSSDRDDTRGPWENRCCIAAVIAGKVPSDVPSVKLSHSHGAAHKMHKQEDK